MALQSKYRIGAKTSKIRITPTIRKRRIEESQTAWNDEIIQRDNNNIYPNLLELYISNSVYTKSTINALRNSIYGKAFNNENLNNTIFYNELGLVLSGKQLLDEVIKDFSVHSTFALHVKYNMLGQVASIKPIPVKNCRFSKPSDNGVITQIAYFDNWEGFSGNLYMDEPVFLPIFNPDNVFEEFDAIGFENHKGHIFFYKSGFGKYPESIWDAAIIQIQTDVEIANFRYKLVQNSLNATHLLAIPHLQDPAQLQELSAKINNAQGSENAGSVIVIDGMGKDSVPSLLALDSKNHDKMYTIIDESVKSNIRMVVNAPPSIIGDLVAGKLGSTAEIAENEAKFEADTWRFRMDIEEGLYDVISKFYIPFYDLKIKTKYGN